MQREFLNVYRSRSTSGLVNIALAVFVIVIGFTLALFSDGKNRSYGDYFLSVAFIGSGVVLFGKFLSEYRNAEEWEFRANAENIKWTRRNKLEQRVEGVIAISSILALIYRTGDSDSGPYLELVRVDGLIELFPSHGGSWNAKQMRAFLKYWSDVHPEIPIRNR